MLFRRRVLSVLVALSLLAPSLAGGGGASPGEAVPAVAAAGPVMTVADVSPDLPYGSRSSYSPYGSDPGGRVLGVAVDPGDPQTVYAVSDTAGVWKTTDGARTWRQAIGGLRSGLTSTHGPALALDAADPRRLLYSTLDDDQRPNHPFGGLWVSQNGALTWTHVALPTCDPDPLLRGVTFGGGRAFAATRCGVARSTGTSLAEPTQWEIVQPPGATVIHRIAARGQTVYACTGDRLWRSTGGGAAGTWTEGRTSPGTCDALAVDPTDSGNVLVAYAHAVDTDDDGDTETVLDVAVRAFAADTNDRLGTLTRDVFCCGFAVLTVVARPGATQSGPGRGYDVFAGNKFRFYQYRAASDDWRVLGGWDDATQPGMHVDTWGLAVAYAPGSSTCTAYAGNDGGTYANTDVGAPCDLTRPGAWRRAMSGLHAFNTYNITGISQPACGNPARPCPTLYLPSAHNGTWATPDGGATWRTLRCCGDNGTALIDPEQPGIMLTARNGTYQVYRSADGRPPTFGSQATDNIYAPYFWWGIAPPQLAALTQILALPGQVADADGDYLALRSPARVQPGETQTWPAPPSNDDSIMRNRRGTADGWVEIAPAARFVAGTIAALAAAGGRSTPTIWVLTASFDPANQAVTSGAGLVYRGTVEAATGRVPSFDLASNGLARAVAFFADPYQAMVAYAADAGDNTVKSTMNGGQSWVREPLLTDLATRYGQYRFECGSPARPGGSAAFEQLCPLTHVHAVRGRPTLRFAALMPGGLAFTRDSGRNWLPLTGALGPLDHPYAVWYDPTINPQTGSPNLYVSLQGGGLRRIDAPFPTLSALTYEVRGLPDGRRASIVNETTALRTQLARDADGVYRGVELFDSARTTATTFRYHLEMAHGVEPTVTLRSPSVNRVLSTTERTSGATRVEVPFAVSAFVLNAPTVAYVEQPQAWLGRYTDIFGGGLINARLSFARQGGASVGEFSYDASNDRLCLHTLGSLPACRARGLGGRLANAVLDLDVAGTQPTVSGTELNILWAFTLKEAAASARYTVVAGGQDDVLLPLIATTRIVGVTHRPRADSVTASATVAPPFTPTGFTATVSDPDGASELALATLTFGGTGAALTLRYDAQINRLSIDDGGTLSPTCAPGSGFISTTRASVLCDQSSVSRDGPTLRVTWRASFSTALSGQRYTRHLRVTDALGGDSGAVDVGTYPIDSPPQLLSLAPTSGASDPSTFAVFTASFGDSDGRANLDRAELHFLRVASSGFLVHDVDLYYLQATNRVSITNGGSATIPAGCTPGTKGTLATPLATLDCQGTTVTPILNAINQQVGVRVAWRVALVSGGTSYQTWLAARDAAGVRTGLTSFGTWRVNVKPFPGTNDPRDGVSRIDEPVTIATTCADPDGWRDIATIDVKVAEGAGLGYGERLALWVQFDQNRNLVRFYDPDNGTWSEGTPGAAGVLSSRYAALDLAGTRVQGSGPTGPSVTITWAITFKEAAVVQHDRQYYQQFIEITDDLGQTTGLDRVGSWTIRR